jgi:hypothetical protein
MSKIEAASYPPIATPEFKAEIVEVCQRSDHHRLGGQRLRSDRANLRTWVKQADIDQGGPDQRGA